MKALRFFAAPYLFITAVLLVLISGEHLGGFYLLYLLLALPHGGAHALLAAGGILCLVLAHERISWQRGLLKLIGVLAGVLLMAASLFTFFINDKAGYNDSTFDQSVPIATFVLAGVLGLVFIGLNIRKYLQLNTHGSHMTA